MVDKYSSIKKRSSVADIQGVLPILVLLNEMVEDNIIQDFAIGGGFATGLHDVPYTTEDIDVFCVFNIKTTFIDLSPIYKYLQARGAKWEGNEFLVGTWPIEFIPPTNELSEEALNNAMRIEIKGVQTKLFTPEYLVAIALDTNRPKDKLKAIDLVSGGRVDISLLEKILEKHNLNSRWQILKKNFEL